MSSPSSSSSFSSTAIPVLPSSPSSSKTVSETPAPASGGKRRRLVKTATLKAKKAPPSVEAPIVDEGPESPEIEIIEAPLVEPVGFAFPTIDAVVSMVSDVRARDLGRKYNIPGQYGFTAPTAGVSVDRPPEGYISVYEEHLRCGLRFPLLPFVVSLLGYYRIALCQIAPNGMSTILGFSVLCRQHECEASVLLFRRFHQLKSAGTGAFGWYTFYPCKNQPKLVDGKPSSIKKWKDHFFLAKALDFEQAGVGSACGWNDNGIEDRWTVSDEDRTVAELAHFVDVLKDKSICVPRLGFNLDIAVQAELRKRSAEAGGVSKEGSTSGSQRLDLA